MVFVVITHKLFNTTIELVYVGFFSPCGTNNEKYLLIFSGALKTIIHWEINLIGERSSRSGQIDDVHIKLFWNEICTCLQLKLSAFWLISVHASFQRKCVSLCMKYKPYGVCSHRNCLLPIYSHFFVTAIAKITDEISTLHNGECTLHTQCRVRSLYEKKEKRAAFRLLHDLLILVPTNWKDPFNLWA